MYMQVAVLPGLTVADIGEVIRNTLLVESTETVMARLRLAEGQRFIEFCSAIQYLSGGIPLFVLKALQVGACHPAAAKRFGRPVTELLICRVRWLLTWIGRPCRMIPSRR